MARHAALSEGPCGICRDTSARGAGLCALPGPPAAGGAGRGAIRAQQGAARAMKSDKDATERTALRPLEVQSGVGLATRATAEDACGAAVHLCEAAAIGLPVTLPVASFPLACVQSTVRTAHA